jgi:hypothetical protein
MLAASSGVAIAVKVGDSARTTILPSDCGLFLYFEKMEPYHSRKSRCGDMFKIIGS